ncbi:aminoacyl-tRNA hydrolase [Reinekea marina]|uniref:Peptidyl-tRNA hydrolase n=1 Tax=Reinekea marina TaxID=1310421 RepID=A0ABV7WTT2_9GAMM|nr:aminoacyl-tRNA hydrolase [Reinekea marina]MDN3648859.1 aminoacyl-tRNA hydrolase [Reinekea marina]
MKDSIQLVVGLGNPGAQYENTRHNAGFDYIDALARKYGGSWKFESKYGAEICSVLINANKIWLIKPMSFMNRSGQAVGAFSNFYKIPVENILVAHDELDIEPGTARFKQGGGHGGHNGLRDIIAALANNRNFYRLRLGIGHPGHAKEVADFVLSKAPVDDRISLERAYDCAIEQTELAFAGNWSKAMNNLHSFKPE